MRSLKKAAAVLLTAAMTMTASVMAFADQKVTFHFQNSDGWEEVGGYIFQGISWTTNVTDNTYIVVDKADGTQKKLWPGAKCTEEKEGWYTCTATFTDEVVSDGMIFKFNNFVGDASTNDTTEQDDVDAIKASGIKTTETAEKKETTGILINKKMIANDLGGSIPTDLYIEYAGGVATWSATAPDSYKNAAAVGGSSTSTGGDNTGASAGSSDSTGTATGTTGSTGTTTGSASTGSSSSTSKAPTTGDSVATAVVMSGLLAAVVVVVAKKKVNA